MVRHAGYAQAQGRQLRNAAGVKERTLRWQSQWSDRRDKKLRQIVDWQKQGGKVEVFVRANGVESVPELLRRFDVDCAAVSFEPATGKTFMTPRAKRAFETGCNVLDSRFNSSAYAERLWKYTCRGFGVAVPGLDLHLASPKISQDN